ncbi:EamA family transporter [Phycisphaerales bacterium AB-hyl4]|uniref:EamA family transporter n=1 Tax=Natronomicrosphaera hydrolytica TaxID=3242702 RepID=A0ABV4U964_9BACT
MVALGVMFGLLTAVLQSVAYLLSRNYGLRAGGGMVRLLVKSHVIQAVVAVPFVWLLWSSELPPWGQWIWPTVGVGAFYLVGQMGLFLALKRTTASRVSPLLGLKVAILAVLTAAWLGDDVSAWQWAAVGLAVAAAFAINYTGGPLPTAAVVTMLVTCTGYALSDVCIRLMIEAMEPLPPTHAALLGVVLVYFGCGVVLAPLLPWYGSRRVKPWLRVMPYAWTWLISMATLFVCFALVGVVLGNILQSTRGVISILLVPLVVGRGFVHVETQLPRAVFWRRVGAAVMMFAAVVLYLAG